MKIKFIKEYRAIGDFGMPGKAIIARSLIGDTADNLDDEDAQWLIDNGFAEEVKESGWWRPKYCEKYFYIGHDGSVYSSAWAESEIDNGRLKLGSVFKTKKATERYRDYLKAIATVRQDEGVLTPEKVREALNQYGTVYTVGTNATALSVKHFYNASAGAVYFDTLYNANTSIGNHLDEWEIITNYDWSRE